MVRIRYVLMSIWQVPYYQSKDLMVNFYRYRLEGRMSIPEAFSRAQLEMKNRYWDPLFWAGFLLRE